jgi:nitrile hydratase accessory protein
VSAGDDIHALDGEAAVPRKNGELVFDAPWQSRAFGMVVGLHQRGVFSWNEFKDRLIAAIAENPPTDDASPAAVYYRQWLAALESLLLAKGLLSDALLDARAGEFISGARE